MWYIPLFKEDNQKKCWSKCIFFHSVKTFAPQTLLVFFVTNVIYGAMWARWELFNEESLQPTNISHIAPNPHQGSLLKCTLLCSQDVMMTNWAGWMSWQRSKDGWLVKCNEWGSSYFIAAARLPPDLRWLLSSLIPPFRPLSLTLWVDSIAVPLFTNSISSSWDEGPCLP